MRKKKKRKKKRRSEVARLIARRKSRGPHSFPHLSYTSVSSRGAREKEGEKKGNQTAAPTVHVGRKKETGTEGKGGKKKGGGRKKRGSLQNGGVFRGSPQLEVRLEKKGRGERSSMPIARQKEKKRGRSAFVCFTLPTRR